MLLSTHGAHALTTFRMDPPISSLMATSLSDTLPNPRIPLTSSSLTTIPIPPPLSSAPLQNNLHLPRMPPISLPLYFASRRHIMSTFLCSIISVSSPPPPAIAPILKSPILMSEHLPLHNPRRLPTRSLLSLRCNDVNLFNVQM